MTADYEGKSDWGENDPSVFIMNMFGRLQGEVQLTNGYGPLKAPQIMRVRITFSHTSSVSKWVRAQNVPYILKVFYFGFDTFYYS